MKRLLFVALLGSVASVALGQYSTLDRIRQRGTIAFGVDPNNMPFSSATNQPPGFDIEIAQKLAERLGVAFKPVWVRSQHPSYPAQLMKKRCDALIGVAPKAMADEKGMLFTKPYCGTGFLPAVCKNAPQSNSAVGIEAGVVVEKLKDMNPREYPSQTAILTALRNGELSTGYVGAVQGGWLLKNHPEWNLELLTADAPADHWNVVIAVRKNSPELKAALDKAIQELLDANEFEPILKKYGIPFYPPFP
jgi:ABC-type amino acid transport substrate-binding protein